MNKTVCEVNKCNGCYGCEVACPKNAISVKDELEFYNAYIDENKCINCKLCEQVCPNVRKPEFNTPIIIKEGWVLDSIERDKSSSGGVATAIAKKFIENGGVVCSCFYKNGEFIFGLAQSPEEVNKFRGSKYVKSNPKAAFEIVKSQLKLDKKVLVIGLPCQIAAIKNYINPKQYDNLYTIDLICHGSPSKKILEKYLVENKLTKYSFESIDFRKNNTFKIFLDSKPTTQSRIPDKYVSTFLKCLHYTENCYNCQFAKLERCSDITLGDNWGTNQCKEQVAKGISLILCSTQKGVDLLNQSNIELFDVDADRAIRANTQLNHPSNMPKERTEFFEIFSKKGFNKAYKNIYPKDNIKSSIKKILYKVKYFKD